MKIKHVCMMLVAILCLQACQEEAVDMAQKSGESSGYAAAYDLTNWMGALDDDVSLSELSIPGTHDSGAMYDHVLLSGTAKCQDLTIGEQLQAGTRFLDIRCRHYYDAFTIHHGVVYQNMNFDDVINYCNDFLSNHPTETIIMCVKEEYDADGNSQTFEETFDSYVDKNPDLWYLSSTIPQLGDVRGKIVLFRRFSASTTPKGLNATAWQDNTTFSISNGDANMKVQDVYQVSDNDDKWTAISDLLSEAASGNSSTLYVNFTSGYYPGIFGIPSIPTVSDDINPLITSYFTSNTSGRYGIIPMDFSASGRNSLIIDANF